MSEVDHWDFVLCSYGFLSEGCAGWAQVQAQEFVLFSLCSLTHALTRALAYADGTVLGEAVGLHAHLFLGPLPLPEKRPSPR